MRKAAWVVRVVVGGLPLCGFACVGLATAQQRDTGEPRTEQNQDPEHVNRLADETSPYLRQHRHNPVDWYPWGDAAFARARELDRPIFLSIGYSSCHWCHVMAEESFEDEDVARYLNENYVCIKVDREERPDVDQVYMGALQAMGKRGGWPLSAWLTPDGKPFFGGTYFPPGDANGRPGFERVCRALAEAWRDDRERVLNGADELAKHLQTALAPSFEPGEPSADMLTKIAPQARERYDPQHPGFAYPPEYAPKFPHATELQTLLRLDGDDGALEMAYGTLHAMRRGGIHDHLGGGFHRYSTDRRWLVPHFEKMLYDNALLASCYLEAFLRSSDERFRRTARDTLDYMMREMQAPGGGFWSSQDAQSEGVEGKFFVWDKSEIDALLGDASARFCEVYGVTEHGNWEHHNVLWRAVDASAEAGVDDGLQASRRKLFEVRAERIAPGTDDKILAEWNGLALTAMCDGYRVLGDARYKAAAVRAATVLVDTLVEDGRVRRSIQGGEARHRGTLDDHGGLADGLVSVFEVDPDARWLETARAILLQVDAHFSSEDGGFWMTPDDGEQLLARSRSVHEGSTPPGSATATRAFLRLGLLLGDRELYERGVRALRAHHALLQETPAAASSLVLALQFHVGKPKEIVVCGEPDDERTVALLQAAWRRFPEPAVVALLHDGNRERLERLSPVFRGKQAGADGAPQAFVCEQGVCLAPTSDPEALR